MCSFIMGDGIEDRSASSRRSKRMNPIQGLVVDHGHCGSGPPCGILRPTPRAMPTASSCSLVEASCSSFSSIHIEGGEIMIDAPVANTVVPGDAGHTANIMPIQTRREFKQLREARASDWRNSEVKILKLNVSKVAYCDKFAVPKWSSGRRESDGVRPSWHDLKPQGPGRARRRGWLRSAGQIGGSSMAAMCVAGGENPAPTVISK